MLLFGKHRSGHYCSPVLRGFSRTPQRKCRKCQHRSRFCKGKTLVIKEQAMPATAHLSYWHETAGELTSHYPTLETDINVEIAIIGGGITGLTAAAHLARLGRRVAVLESGQIGSGTTGFTSGHLDATTDFDLSKMIFEFGQSA